MKTSRLIAPVLGLLILGAAAAYAAERLRADPFEYDPVNTRLVQSTWLPGIGCPTNGKISLDGSTSTPYTDPACTTGDSRDRQNQGLLLVKTGPTGNYASAGVVLTDVRGITLTELGYDIRKPGVSLDPRGSHCGAGAPRFNVTTRDGRTFFIGCNSPPAPVQVPGNGWLRLRWGVTVPVQGYDGAGTLTDLTGLQVDKISIVFDEGQDTAPDNFGAAILDNIDINANLVGQGPIVPGTDSGHDGDGRDSD